MTTKPYLVLSGNGTIQAWSTERLKFDVKNTWHRDFRGELGLALEGLSTGENRFLDALYASPVRESCDTENILFYNVGTGAFADVTARGLRFERGYSCPEPPVGLVGSARHYHRYERGEPGQEFTYWLEDMSVLRVPDVALPGLTQETKPALVWLAVRRAAIEASPARDVEHAFALRLHLTHPASRGSAASVMKPLLDGVVAAFHSYDGLQLEEVSRRLATQLALPKTVVSALLQDRRGAPLGSLEVVFLRASGVQWNPADDRCVACELVVERDSSAASPVLDVDLRTVTTR